MNKGVKCWKCRKVTKFPPYVFAHWQYDLLFECQNCKTKHSLKKGKLSAYERILA